LIAAQGRAGLKRVARKCAATANKQLRSSLQNPIALLHWHAGDIDWVPIQRHAGENLAHEPLEFLAIVPKTTGAAAK
jgi:hypothetical protein